MAAQKVSFFKTCSGFSYDVFLSFRGEDTRSTFTDHLYTALVYAGFRTFRDDPELERGENIKQKLVKAIQQSRSSVIVLSKDYTSSRWCLDELVMILERKRTSDHVVIPVFYDVEPSDVRKQAENLAKVPKYQENQSTGKLNGWLAALREVADLSGIVLRNEADGYEAKFIQNIVGVIQYKLGLRAPLSDVQEVLQTKLLYVNSVLDDAEGKQLNNPTVKDWLNDIPRIRKFPGSTSEGRINNINWGNQGDVVTGVGGDFIRHVHGNIIKDAHIEVPRVVGVFQDKLGRPVPLSVVQEILQKKLLYVNSVVDDVEGKQLNNPTVKDWLNDLKKAVYDADDLLQEIKTEALRQEMESESVGSSTSKVQELVSRPPCHAFDSALIITETEKVRERLEDIVKQKKQYLGLEASAGHKRLRQATTRETASLVDESGVYGRDQDKEVIVKLLLSNDDAAGEKISVIPIIGMGGIGKTTLSQLVYNDIRVEQHFELQAWVCISDVEFDVTRITQTIFESVTGNPYHGSRKLDSIQNELKKKLRMKRFLLVLDDVWNQNYMEWDKLRQPFESGAFGSKIIVTTRSKCVASAMCILPSHRLMQISDEDCWLLFARHAFGNADLLNSQYPALAIIGKQIATKCKGLPLAAKSLGGLLRSELNVEEWEEILKSDIWELAGKETNILPALWLSYRYLPSHLKRCFAYCAIFPKDYHFTKSKMVLLWMAEDLLQPEKKKTLEQVGDAYFVDLFSRSFFQSSSTPELDPIGESESHFTMHDLINDLAKFVSGEFCFRLEDHNSLDIVSQPRHFSYTKSKANTTNDFPNLEALKKAKSLHTFLTFEKGFLFSLELVQILYCFGLHDVNYLRLLDLSRYEFWEFPNIGNLKHLRYLDLSHSLIKKLPDELCTFYNLQTLLLSSCQALVGLPTNMGRLIKLRHVDISNTKIKKMPPNMGKLKDLQFLSNFVLDKDTGENIVELKELPHLHKRLCISGLDNIVCKLDSSEVNISGMKYLKELVLKWGDDNHDTDDCGGYTEEEFGVSIDNWRDNIDDWGGDSEDHTDDSGGDTDDSGGDTDDLGDDTDDSGGDTDDSGGDTDDLGDDTDDSGGDTDDSGSDTDDSGQDSIRHWQVMKLLQPHANLQSLSIESYGGESFPNWVGDNSFSNLSSVALVDCKFCLSFPPLGQLPSLVKLHIKGSKVKSIGLEFYGCGVKPFRFLNELSFVDMLEWQEWCYDVEEEGEIFPNLRKLTLKSCPKLTKMLPSDKFPKLESLQLSSLNFTGCLLSQESKFMSLSLLKIEECPKFECFPDGGIDAPKLKNMSIVRCKKFRLLLEGMQTLVPSLEELTILSCPKFKAFPESGLAPSLVTLILDCNKKLLANGRLCGLQRLNSLLKLAITRIESSVFPEGLFPTSLTDLRILDCPNLTTLDDKWLRNLHSLQTLLIGNWPQLQCLPEEGLPTTVSLLCVFQCPVLERRLQRGEGADWPKIAHIPHIWLDSVDI